MFQINKHANDDIAVLSCSSSSSFFFWQYIFEFTDEEQEHWTTGDAIKHNINETKRTQRN